MTLLNRELVFFLPFSRIKKAHFFLLVYIADIN